VEKSQLFTDRSAAGRQLAKAIDERNLRRPFLVLGLPRGGVPVAYEVSRALRAPLDVMVVRKIGMPGQSELAIGAVASGGVTVRQPRFAGGFGGIELPFEQLAESERAELARRERAYRADARPLLAKGATVILVDDGLATGATMVAAVRAARKMGAGTVVAAAPVASSEAAAIVRAEADEVVILETPANMFAIGQWYLSFRQLEDSEVRDFLARARGERPSEVAAPRLGHSGLARFEGRLRARQAELRKEIRDTLLRTDSEQYGLLAGEVHDAAEQSVADLLVDVNLAEITRDVEDLRDVEAALERIHTGAYGACLRCNGPIDLERLEAYPTAKRCLPCQLEHEHARAETAPATL
jgi:predicted phosphoribosyltransferase/RNA polymerase-binding transcription factor DksA